MLHVFLVMLDVFRLMLHVFPVTLQETRATLQETPATLQETRPTLQETCATLHASASAVRVRRIHKAGEIVPTKRSWIRQKLTSNQCCRAANDFINFTVYTGQCVGRAGVSITHLQRRRHHMTARGRQPSSFPCYNTVRAVSIMIETRTCNKQVAYFTLTWSTSGNLDQLSNYYMLSPVQLHILNGIDISSGYEMPSFAHVDGQLDPR